MSTDNYAHFFECDVPGVYRRIIIDRFRTHLKQKDISALRDDLEHYAFLLSPVVERQMSMFFYSKDVFPGEELELLERLFKEYALI